MEGELKNEIKCDSDEDHTPREDPDSSANTGNISDGSREDINSHREHSDSVPQEQEEVEGEEHDDDDDDDDDEEEEEEEEEEEVMLGEMLEVILDETLEEEDMDYSPSSRRRSEVDTTETETDESDSEDFPTESLLKELHYLNASCERPLVEKNPTSNTHRSPKKQRRLDFGLSSVSVRGSSSVAGSREGSSTSYSGRNLRKRTNTLPSLVKLSPRKAELRKKYKPEIVMSSETSDNDEEEIDDDDNDEDDEDEGVLTIVTQEEQKQQQQQQHQLISGKRKTPPSPQTNSSGGRKRVRREESSEVPEEVVKLIQSGIDDLLEEKAERTHLTAVHVKNIIKNVMTDENVVAMVRNTVVGLHSDDSGVSAVYEPTLTRAKTKELLEQQQKTGGVGCIWAGLTTHTTNPSTSCLDPETHALATIDFPDEDESDEYHPEADDQVHSEEESMLSCGVSNEGGSPSSTPNTPTTTHISTSTPTSAAALSITNHPSALGLDTPSSMESSVFCVPNSAQRALKFEKEEVVSQRTRSKLPLTETPLECLEMAFLPPDVTTDMYETEVDNDDWKKFLIDFIHPLKTCEGGEEEEDPEYNILEDAEDAQDLKEEMRGDRAVQISKKEIQQLMTELLDTLEDSDVAPPIRAHLAPLLPHQQQSSASQPSDQHTVSEHINTPTNTHDEVDGPPPGTIWVEVLTAKFTLAQLEVIRCQMTQHVQLLATSAVMAAGCSPHTHILDGCIDNLEEVQQMCDSSEYKHTFFSTVNLKAAVDLSKAMMEKNYDEQNIKYKKKGRVKTNMVSLKPDLIEAILLSSAFPYPRLLPIRMFQLPCMRGYDKTIFVPGEDVLLLMGLERYLDPKYRSITNKNEKQRLLNVALSKTVKELLVTKTLPQVVNRVRNIRSRVKDAPSNSILKFLNKGEVDTPAAEAEPLLVCVPCPVLEMPESVLAPPFKAIVTKRNETLRVALKAAASEAATRAAKELEIQKLEATYQGRGTIIQQQVPNIVIVQPSVGMGVAAVPVDNNLQPLSFIIQAASPSSESSVVTLQPQPQPQQPQTPFVVCPVSDESSNNDGGDGGSVMAEREGGTEIMTEGMDGAPSPFPLASVGEETSHPVDNKQDDITTSPPCGDSEGTATTTDIAKPLNEQDLHLGDSQISGAGTHITKPLNEQDLHLGDSQISGAGTHITKPLNEQDLHLGDSQISKPLNEQVLHLGESQIGDGDSVVGDGASVSVAGSGCEGKTRKKKAAVKGKKGSKRGKAGGKKRGRGVVKSIENVNTKSEHNNKTPDSKRRKDIIEHQSEGKKSGGVVESVENVNTNIEHNDKQPDIEGDNDMDSESRKETSASPVRVQGSLCYHMPSLFTPIKEDEKSNVEMESPAKITGQVVTSYTYTPDETTTTTTTTNTNTTLATTITTTTPTTTNTTTPIDTSNTTPTDTTNTTPTDTTTTNTSPTDTTNRSPTDTTTTNTSPTPTITTNPSPTTTTNPPPTTTTTTNPPPTTTTTTNPPPTTTTNPSPTTTNPSPTTTTNPPPTTTTNPPPTTTTNPPPTTTTNPPPTTTTNSSPTTTTNSSPTTTNTTNTPTTNPSLTTTNTSPTTITTNTPTITTNPSPATTTDTTNPSPITTTTIITNPSPTTTTDTIPSPTTTTIPSPTTTTDTNPSPITTTTTIPSPTTTTTNPSPITITNPTDTTNTSPTTITTNPSPTNTPTKNPLSLDTEVCAKLNIGETSTELQQNSPENRASNSPENMPLNSPENMSSNSPGITSNSPEIMSSNSPENMSLNSPEIVSSKSSPKPLTLRSPKKLSELCKGRNYKRGRTGVGKEGHMGSSSSSGGGGVGVGVGKGSTSVCESSELVQRLELCGSDVQQSGTTNTTTITNIQTTNTTTTTNTKASNTTSNTTITNTQTPNTTTTTNTQAPNTNTNTTNIDIQTTNTTITPNIQTSDTTTTTNTQTPNTTTTPNIQTSNTTSNTNTTPTKLISLLCSKSLEPITPVSPVIMSQSLKTPDSGKRKRNVNDDEESNYGVGNECEDESDTSPVVMMESEVPVTCMSDHLPQQHHHHQTLTTTTCNIGGITSVYYSPSQQPDTITCTQDTSRITLATSTYQSPSHQQPQQQQQQQPGTSTCTQDTNNITLATPTYHSPSLHHQQQQPVTSSITLVTMASPMYHSSSQHQQQQPGTSSCTQGTSSSSSITLVTSVYHSPIFSSRVDNSASPLSSPVVTPHKTPRPLRRISPAKKTSPMKQVSPILRKYRKYSPKKRQLKTKLAPILPKVSFSQRMQSSPSSCHRKLAPKPSKCPSTTQEPSSNNSSVRRKSHSNTNTATTTITTPRVKRILVMKECVSGGGGDGDLVPLEDHLINTTTTTTTPSTTTTSTTSTTTKHSQQFEDDTLEYLDEEEEEEEEVEEEEDDEEEEEEEEEDDEEENIEAEQQREEHLAALLKASSTISLRRGGGGGGGGGEWGGMDKRLAGELNQGGRRLSKQQQRLQARITALTNTPDTNTQDKVMAQSYLTRVREALMSKEPAAFKKFLNLLSEFMEKPDSSPLDLYKQLSEVLKDHPHLSEEFVSFLLPQQAIAIGKYAQYCAIHRMRDFLEKLELQFGSQPQYIQKIMRQLQVLQSRHHLDSDEVKTAMTPLLRYPHLVECFSQCFSSQPPTHSLPDDFEEICLERGESPDSVESLVLPDDDLHTSPSHCMCVCHAPSTMKGGTEASQLSPPHATRTEHCQSCAIRFSEGRVYLQCGKTLRPAKVTYQAVKNEHTDDDNNTKKHQDATNNQQQQHTNASECTDGGMTGKVKAVGKTKPSQVKDSCDNTPPRDASGQCVPSVISTAVSGMDTSTVYSLEISPVVSSENTTLGFGGETSPTGVKTLAVGLGVRTTMSGTEVCTVKPVRQQGSTEDTCTNQTVSTMSLTVPTTPVSTMNLTLPTTPVSTMNLTVPTPVSTISLTLPTTPVSTMNLTLPTSPVSTMSLTVPTTPVRQHTTSMDTYYSGDTLSMSPTAGSATSHTCVESSNKWSKDEDQTILMTVQQRGVSEDVFRDIACLLPTRNTQEVTERFNTLLNLMMEEVSDVDETVSVSSDDSTMW